MCGIAQTKPSTTLILAKATRRIPKGSRPFVNHSRRLALSTLQKEQIMTDPKIKMACHEHHLAAARHVAAAYHHFQAVAAHENGNHVEATAQANAAQTEGGAANKHATVAVGHCH